MVSRTKKFRGSRTHGRGRKAGRGAGLRGGRGMAGLHKHRFMHMLKYYPDHFGRRGFKRPPGTRGAKRCMNLMELEEALPRLLEGGMANRREGYVHIDLSKIGIDKLLAKGRVTTKLKVEVEETSGKAKAKIEGAGGQVISGASEEDAGEKDKEKKESEGLNAGGT
ncbi:MAG: uL15 family ribosomal protein [Thermoplasmata archaeon]|nr:uL15 family ribosomal protein [Thermoplasmata archaeon]